MVQNTEPGKPNLPQQQQQPPSSIAQPITQTIQQIQPPDENSLEAAPQTEIPPSPAINGTSTTPINQIQQQQHQQQQQPNGHIVPNGQMENNDEKQVSSTDAESPHLQHFKNLLK